MADNVTTRIAYLEAQLSDMTKKRDGALIAAKHSAGYKARVEKAEGELAQAKADLARMEAMAYRPCDRCDHYAQRENVAHERMEAAESALKEQERVIEKLREALETPCSCAEMWCGKTPHGDCHQSKALTPPQSDKPKASDYLSLRITENPKAAKGGQ